MNQHTFEQTVLAYLDGMLDRREEHAFLDEVRRDPEKRALLEQHRELRMVLEKQRSSYLPPRTERALTERIPALRNIPPLEEAALVHASKGLRSLLSIRRVALLLTSGAALIVLMSLFQGSVPTPEAFVDDAGGRTTMSEGDGASMREGARTAPVDDGEATTHAYAVHGKSHRRSTEDDNESASSQQRNSPQRSDDHGGSVEVKRILSGSRQQEHSSPGKSASQPGHQENAASPSPAVAMRSAPESTTLRGIALFPVSNRADRLEPGPPFQAVMAVLGRTLQVYLESGAAMREMRSSDQRVGDGYGAQYLVGLRWEFDPFISAGVEFGQSALARVGQTSRISTMESSPGMEILIVENTIEEAGRNWMRAQLFYTINPEDLIQYQATAGSGLLLGSESSFIFSIGAAVQYPFRNNLYLRAGLHYSGTWLDASEITPLLPQAGSSPIAYKFPSAKPGPMYNSSIQFRIGVGYLLW